MNWYKMANINDWESARRELFEELGREPLAYEIQERMLKDDFSEENKKVPVMASKWKDKLKGGLADKKTPSDFSKEDLEKGLRVEFEHTNDPDIAREITMDHLEEHDDYYVGLECMEDCLTEIEDRAKKENKKNSRFNKNLK